MKLEFGFFSSPASVKSDKQVAPFGKMGINYIVKCGRFVFNIFITHPTPYNYLRPWP